MWIELENKDDNPNTLVNSDYVADIVLDKIDKSIIVDLSNGDSMKLNTETIEKATELYNNIKQELFRNDLLERGNDDENIYRIR